MNRLFFRLDASPEIGLGHARRCAVLAQAAQALGAETYFALRVSGVTPAALGLPAGAVVEELPWDDTAEDLIDFCRSHGVTCGVVDHYRQTELYQRTLLSAGLKWMQFYNPGLDMPFHGHLLHSAADDPSLAIVPAEFAHQRERMPPWEQREEVLITFGGGDDRGAINAALDLLDEAGWPYRRIVLTTSMNPRRHEIRRGEVILDNFAPASIMTRCRAAICAGGTTLYELATLGVPAFIITIAENQVVPAEKWEAAGLGRWLGRLGESLKPLDDSYLREWSNACLSSVDGLGAARTAQALMKLCTPCQS